MRGGIQLGRVFGIRVVLDWSWLLILLLVVWNLAVGLFPRLHPEWSPAVTWGTALAAAFLFFLSILFHELAHSLLATARGLPVRDIRLFMFGGVSNIEREPTDPKTEFWVALVGPLTSFFLGAIFLAIGMANGPLSDMRILVMPMLFAGLNPAQTLLLWLGPINILLGLFNLIPGFPLDGGRILRSIMWGLTGSFQKATRWAARFGQLIAWALILSGIAMVFGVEIPFFGSGPVSGIWLAFIGWFLNNAADQSYRQVVVSDLLEGLTVQRVMRQAVRSVTPEMTIDQLVDSYVMGSDERAFPVQLDGRLVGLVCLSDIRKIARAEWPVTPVRQIMTDLDQLQVVSPQAPVTEALQTLTRRDLRQLPVVEQGQLVGMLRRADIVRWLQIQADQA